MRFKTGSVEEQSQATTLIVLTAVCCPVTEAPPAMLRHIATEAGACLPSTPWTRHHSIHHSQSFQIDRLKCSGPFSYRNCDALNTQSLLVVWWAMESGSR